MGPGSLSLVSAVIAADVSDPTSTRRVYLVIAGLVLVGGLLAAFTVWYWRSTRPEPPALGRLEAMGLRRWRDADYMDRRTQLDDVGAFDGGEGPLAEADVEPEPSAASISADDLAHLVESTPEQDAEWDAGPLVPVSTVGDEGPDSAARDLPGEPLL